MKKFGWFARVLAMQVSLAILPRLHAQGANTNAPRPNILFILADDLGAESSALYPGLYNANAPRARGQVATPTISALASRGLVFDNVWAMPVCSPTRAALLTGLYGHNTGVTTVGDVLPGNTTSVFELLASSATTPRYKTAVFGKWHLGGTGAAGINHVVQETGVPIYKGLLGGLIPNYYNWTVESSADAPAPTRVYATTALTDFAIDFVRSQKAGEPWFVYLPYNAPHGTAPNDGFQVPPADLFKVNVGALPKGAETVYNGQAAIPVYQAIIQALDTEIGRLFKAMGEAGQLDNTIVVFMGDNGTPGPVKDPAARIRGSKGSVYEGGVRVPLVVAGPGVTRRGRDAHLVTATDMYATLAQLAGVTPPRNAANSSFSIVPLLSNSQATTGRTHSFTELCPNTDPGPMARQIAVRDRRYKLHYAASAWQMFDLEADPWETTNVYNNPQYAGIRAALLGELRALKANAATPGCFTDIPGR